MENVSVGDVIFVRFPFSDLSNYKLRPALVLASTDKRDYILCQITSKAFADKQAIILQSDSFEKGSLIKTSYIRPSKLFTANSTIIQKMLLM